MDPLKNKKGTNLRGILPIKDHPFRLIEGYNKRKCQVLQLAMSNYTNEDISKKLEMSQKTIEKYISEMRKDGHGIPYMQRIMERTSEGLRTIYVCLPDSAIDYMDREARKRKVARNVVVRELLEWGLEAAGAPEEW